MKKVIAILVSILVLGFNAQNVFAVTSEGDSEIVMAYYQEDHLYTYISLATEIDATQLTAEAKVEGEAYHLKEPHMKKLSEHAAPVSYIFLLDISTSMSNYKKNINGFVEHFLDSVQGDASFMLATIGEGFEPRSEFSNNKQDFLDFTTHISYDANQTSIYAGLVDAIHYYNTKERGVGEVFNIVMITDGIEFDDNGYTQVEVTDVINQSTPIFIHTFGLHTKSNDAKKIKESEESLKVLGAFARATLSVHTVFGMDQSTEIELSKQITDFMNGLLCAEFNLFTHKPKGDTFDLGIVFSTTDQQGKMFRLEKFKVPYLDKVNGKDDAPNILETEQLPEEDTTIVEVTDEVVTKDKINFEVFVYITGIIIVVLLSMAIWFLKRKKNEPENSHKKGIFMKLEVIHNDQKVKNNEFYLTDEIVIGRNKTCEIRFKDKEVSDQNTRIFIRDHIIYIEDLNSTNGTAISGMKIYAPNRLRSGDEISIGTVKFKIKF